MVRAVDPDNPRLNGRVFVVDDGKVKQPLRRPRLRARLLRRRARASAWASPPRASTTPPTIFDSKLRPVHEIALTGLPSRARVSADGRYGAMTVFVSGDAYLESPTAFSTRTTIVDMASGKQLGQLEQFDVTKDGKPFDAVDFNFWGVTFDPEDSEPLLRDPRHRRRTTTWSKATSATQTMRVLRDGVECPSLSPDGKQIAYKSRIGDENRWRLRVLDVATLRTTRVAETRSIDDQVEWLDDDTLVYSDERNVYTVPADGSGEPRLLVRDATSPVRLTARDLSQ